LNARYLPVTEHLILWVMIARSVLIGLVTTLSVFAPVSDASALPVVSEVHLIRGTFSAGSQPDGNSVILDTPDGLVVIDTGDTLHIRNFCWTSRAIQATRSPR
jgi:hypothetical protein